jgi:hypothetical protein
LPGLFTQRSAELPLLLATTDDGTIAKDDATLHQVSYLLKLADANSTSTSASASVSTNRMSLSTVKVLYDPQTFLPVSLEYSLHPDTNELMNIPVKVVFSIGRLR